MQCDISFGLRFSAICPMFQKWGDCVKNTINFSDEAKALCLIKVLYEKGVINASTYQSIIKKYDKKDSEYDNER